MASEKFAVFPIDVNSCSMASVKAVKICILFLLFFIRSLTTTACPALVSLYLIWQFVQVIISLIFFFVHFSLMQHLVVKKLFSTYICMFWVVSWKWKRNWHTLNSVMLIIFCMYKSAIFLLILFSFTCRRKCSVCRISDRHGCCLLLECLLRKKKCLSEAGGTKIKFN